MEQKTLLWLPKRSNIPTALVCDALGVTPTGDETMYKHAVWAPFDWHFEWGDNPALATLEDGRGTQLAIAQYRLDAGNENCSLVLAKEVLLPFWLRVFAEDRDLPPSGDVPRFVQQGIDPRFFLAHIIEYLGLATPFEIRRAIDAGGNPGVGRDDGIAQVLLAQGKITEESLNLACDIQQWLAENGVPENKLGWWETN